LLAFVCDQPHPVDIQRETEGHRPDPFTASTLDGEGGTGARTNQVVLVLGRAVDDGANEGVSRGITVAFPARADDASAGDHHRALDGRREHDIARDPIALGDDQDFRLLFAESCERNTQSGTFGDWRDTANALIDAPRHYPNTFPRCPRLDGCTLSFPRKVLFVLRRAEVGYGHAGLVSSHALGHAKSGAPGLDDPSPVVVAPVNHSGLHSNQQLPIATRGRASSPKPAAGRTSAARARAIACGNCERLRTSSSAASKLPFGYFYGVSRGLPPIQSLLAPTPARVDDEGDDLARVHVQEGLELGQRRR
jgi:hypothetical protein